MGGEGWLEKVFQVIIGLGSEWLMGLMIVTWMTTVILRCLVTFTVSRELWFAIEFEKRAYKFIEDAKGETSLSFFVLAKKVLEKTYYELFVVRAIMKRRRPDAVRSLTDRLFLIQHGCARLVSDTLKQIRFLRPEASGPKLLDVAKSTYEYNPCFRRVFGIIPVGGANDFINLMAGLFIVGGIFGTFLGIMRALPELGALDLKDPDASKTIVDTFLLKVAFSMGSSALGIMLSVSLSLLNTFFSAERTFMSAVEKFHNSLDVLWHRTSTNEVPADLAPFDEHRDPIDALAEESVKKEIDRKVPFVNSKAG